VDGVPGPLVAAALGRALVAALDADDADLLRDAFERLRTQWTEWTATAAEDAIDTAARITGLDRSDPTVQRTVAALRDSFAGGRKPPGPHWRRSSTTSPPASCTSRTRRWRPSGRSPTPWFRPG
jgi:hypothetical protein